MGFRRLRCAFRRKSSSRGSNKKSRRQNIAFLLSEIDELQEENAALKAECEQLRDAHQTSNIESLALKERLQNLQIGLTAKMQDFRKVKATKSSRLQEMQQRRIKRTLDRFNSSFHGLEESTSGRFEESTRTARTELSDTSYLHMDTLDLTLEHSRRSQGTAAFEEHKTEIHAIPEGDGQTPTSEVVERWHSAHQHMTPASPSQMFDLDSPEQQFSLDSSYQQFSPDHIFELDSPGSGGDTFFELDPPPSKVSLLDSPATDSLDASTATPISDAQKVNTVAYYDTTGDSGESNESDNGREVFENEYFERTETILEEDDDDSELAVVNGHLMTEYDEIDYSQKGNQDDDEKVHVNGQAYDGAIVVVKMQATGEVEPSSNQSIGSQQTQAKSEEASEVDALRRELRQTQLAKDELFCKHARLNSDYQDVIETLQSALEDVDKLMKLTKEKKHAQLEKAQKKAESSTETPEGEKDSTAPAAGEEEDTEEDNATTLTEGESVLTEAVSMGDVLCFEHAIRDTLLRKLLKIREMGHNFKPDDLDTSHDSSKSTVVGSKNTTFGGKNTAFGSTRKESREMARLRSEHEAHISRMTAALSTKDEEIKSLQEHLSNSLKSMMTISAQMEKVRVHGKASEIPDDISALLGLKDQKSSDDMSFINALDKQSDKFLRDVESSMRKLETDATDTSTVGSMSYDWYFAPPVSPSAMKDDSPRSLVNPHFLGMASPKAPSPRMGSPRAPRPIDMSDMSQIQALRAENFRLKQNFFEENTRLKKEIRKQADTVQVLKTLKKNRELTKADQFALHDDSTSIAYMATEHGGDNSSFRRVSFDDESMGYSQSTGDSIRQWRKEMMKNISAPSL